MVTLLARRQVRFEPGPATRLLPSTVAPTPHFCPHGRLPGVPRSASVPPPPPPDAQTLSRTSRGSLMTVCPSTGHLAALATPPFSPPSLIAGKADQDPSRDTPLGCWGVQGPRAQQPSLPGAGTGVVVCRVQRGRTAGPFVRNDEGINARAEQGPKCGDVGLPVPGARPAPRSPKGRP